MAVISPNAARLRVTDSDRLWLARAVEAEGEPRPLVAQTLVNRWAMLNDRGLRQTLTETVRAYAQPVNPRWYPDGDLAIEEMRRAPESERAELLRRAIKRRDVHSTATLFQPRTVRAVVQAFEGPIEIPAGAVHYAPRTPRRDAHFALLVEGPNAIYAQRGATPGRYRVDRDMVRDYVTRAAKSSPIPALFLAVFGITGLATLLKKNPARW